MNRVLWSYNLVKALHTRFFFIKQYLKQKRRQVAALHTKPVRI
jgi:hypothetical protein